MGTTDVSGPADPPALASKLAAAVARRHALDEIAGAGEAVPPGMLAAAEAEIRAAEAGLRAAVAP